MAPPGHRGPVLGRVLVVAALTAALSGCTVLDDLQRRLAGQPRFVEVELLNEEFLFSPQDLDPGPPPAARGDFTFTVAPGTTDLRVEVAAFFEPLVDPPAPLPLPMPGPQGQASVAITPPEGERRSVNFTENNAESFSVTPPAAGPWGVHVEALGQGRVRVLALATVPQP